LRVDTQPPEVAAKKIIHEVKWLPADPNDTSRVIEPGPQWWACQNWKEEPRARA
jgi:hypothetical protein